jgi:hypothetical protein
MVSADFDKKRYMYEWKPSSGKVAGNRHIPKTVLGLAILSIS